jgi:predicted Zn-dependent peptidase
MVARPGSVQTALRFISLGISRTDPDYLPLVVANRVLGGSSSSRLFQNLREERGYTYGAYSTLSAPRWPGTWSSYASVRTPVTGDAAREFVREIKRLSEDTVPADELARMKRALVGSFARTLESSDGVLARAIEIARYGLPADYWDTYPAKIEAVTAADVRRVAKKYLAGGKVQVVAVGERATLEAALKELGPVEVVDADLKPTP